MVFRIITSLYSSFLPFIKIDKPLESTLESLSSLLSISVTTPLSNSTPAPKDPFNKGFSLSKMLKNPVMWDGTNTEIILTLHN